MSMMAFGRCYLTCEHQPRYRRNAKNDSLITYSNDSGSSRSLTVSNTISLTADPACNDPIDIPPLESTTYIYAKHVQGGDQLASSRLEMGGTSEDLLHLNLEIVPFDAGDLTATHSSFPQPSDYRSTAIHSKCSRLTSIYDKMSTKSVHQNNIWCEREVDKGLTGNFDIVQIPIRSTNINTYTEP